MKKREKEKSRLYYSFIIIYLFVLMTYWTLILSNVFHYFKLTNEQKFGWVGIHIAIIILTILDFYNNFEKKYLDIKYSLLFKDLYLQNNITLNEIVKRFPNYDKRYFLENHKFEQNEIISYLRYNDVKYIKGENIEMTIKTQEKIFKIQCIREKNQTNFISISLLNINDGLYPELRYNMLLDNYKSIQHLISSLN